MTARPRPEIRRVGQRRLLQITPEDCLAYGRNPVGLCLDFTGLDYLTASVLEGSGDGGYLFCSGPPGGPLGVRLVSVQGDDPQVLEGVLRSYAWVGPDKSLRLGPLTTLYLGGQARPAMAYETSGGPAWRGRPGGCAIRFGPLALLLMAEGFGLDCEAVLAHATLGAVARGLTLEEGQGALPPPWPPPESP